MSFTPEMMMMIAGMQQQQQQQTTRPAAGSYLDRPFTHPSYANTGNYSNREVQAMANLLAAKALDESKGISPQTPPQTLPIPPQQLPATTTTPGYVTPFGSIPTPPQAPPVPGPLVSTSGQVSNPFTFTQPKNEPVSQIAGTVLGEIREMRSTILEQQDDIADIREMCEFSQSLHSKHIKSSKKLAQHVGADEVMAEIEDFEAESLSFVEMMNHKRELAWSQRMRGVTTTTTSTTPRITSTSSNARLSATPSTVRITELDDEDVRRPRKLPKTPQRKSATKKPSPKKSTPKRTPKPRPSPKISALKQLRTSLEEKYEQNDNTELIPESGDEMSP